MKAAKAGLSSPLIPSGPVPPWHNCKRTLPVSRCAVHQERGRRLESPGRGSLPGVKPRRGSRRKGTESSRLVQKWRRAESRPLRKRGGEEERGGRERPELRSVQRQTEPPPALGASKRGPAVGRGRREGKEMGGGGEGRGGQAGGAATLSSHLPKALACVRTPRLIHTHGDSTPEGELPVSTSDPDATWRSLPDRPPDTPGPALGRGTPTHRALGCPAKPPGALGA